MSMFCVMFIVQYVKCDMRDMCVCVCVQIENRDFRQELLIVMRLVLCLIAFYTIFNNFFCFVSLPFAICFVCVNVEFVQRISTEKNTAFCGMFNERVFTKCVYDESELNFNVSSVADSIRVGFFFEISL